MFINLINNFCPHSTSVTLDTYTHLTEEQKKKREEAIQNIRISWVSVTILGQIPEQRQHKTAQDESYINRKSLILCQDSTGRHKIKTFESRKNTWRLFPEKRINKPFFETQPPDLWQSCDKFHQKGYFEKEGTQYLNDMPLVK